MILKIVRADIHWLIFYLVITLSWIFVLLTSKSVNEIQTLQSVYGSEFWLDLCSQVTGFENIFSLFLMWVIMSGAMMMPTLVPMLRTYQDLIYTGAGSSLGFIIIIFGFLLVWILYSIATASLQAFFIDQNLININGQFVSPIVSTGLLLSAGLYQFSTLKNSCASKCRAPYKHDIAFLNGVWRPSHQLSVRCGGAKHVGRSRFPSKVLWLLFYLM